MNWIKKNWFKLVLSFLGLILVSSFAFYLVAMPLIREDRIKSENEKKERSEQEQRESFKQNEKMQTLCLSWAEQDFDETFEINSTPGSGDTRWWNSLEVQRITEKRLQDDKDECFRKYPTK